MIGETISHYRIVQKLGAGGMGELYQAHDTTLGRDVALKLLPTVFLHDAERLSLLQREARTLAALNHPNIATIHELQYVAGVHFLVMELVAGETLAERIKTGPLTFENASKIALQIIDALEVAHAKGIIHRDLKPANVMLTPDGLVKVLDFGLAKAFAPEGEGDLSRTATLSEHGVLLGTPRYMSPEQARGMPVDKRTDIWAFGCLLYELLVGKAAFPGDTIGEALVSVLEHAPDWAALPAATPARLTELLHRCLEKDLRRRLRDIGDARIDLLDATAGAAHPELPRAKPFPISRRTLIGALAGAAGVAGVASAWRFWPRAPTRLIRVNLDVSPAQQFAGFS